MARIRILVVDDSLTIRKRIVEVLSADPELEVVAEAPDGKAAIELCEQLRPDVVTMDMMLPVMTGVSATEYIMAFCPTPILIVSASTNRGELFKTYDALAAGAVDVLEKPLGTEANDAWERQLVNSVRRVSRIRVITHPRMRLQTHRRSLMTQSSSLANGEARIVAMGASTGGPGAVLAVLRELPLSFPSPVLLVIHISESFAAAFAEWLDGQVPLTVRYARDGERFNPASGGLVLVATPDRHLEVRGSRIELTSAPERHHCRPSVDVLFESVAREFGPQAIGCLMTGMGKDGAAGLLAIRRAGGRTLVQDEATCVVFGMPGEAVRLGAAMDILPLPAIAPALVRLAGSDVKKRNAT